MIPAAFADDPATLMAFVSGATTGAAGTYTFLSLTILKMTREHHKNRLADKDERIEALEAEVAVMRDEIRAMRDTFMDAVRPRSV